MIEDIEPAFDINDEDSSCLENENNLSQMMFEKLTNEKRIEYESEKAVEDGRSD